MGIRMAVITTSCVIGCAVITRSVSSTKWLDVIRQKRIMLVTQIVNGLLERCVTIAKNIVFFQRFGIDVLRQFLCFVAYFFLERIQVMSQLVNVVALNNELILEVFNIRFQLGL